jgi:hypothetical protein
MVELKWIRHICARIRVWLPQKALLKRDIKAVSAILFRAKWMCNRSGACAKEALFHAPDFFE